MLFNSIEFWGFFAVIFAAYFFVPQKFKWLFLLLASYFFYGYWKPEYLLLLALPTLVDLRRRPRHGRVGDPGPAQALLLFRPAGPLGLLFVFKYLELFRQTLHDLAGYSSACSPWRR